MNSMKKFFLGAALAVGALAMSAAPAQAARVGVYFGARAVGIPACPGPGYAWVGGYWNNGFLGARLLELRRRPRRRPVFRGGIVSRAAAPASTIGGFRPSSCIGGYRGFRR